MYYNLTQLVIILLVCVSPDSDNLIKRFMESSIEKEIESFGEVNLIMELKQNPGMDKTLNVKGGFG